MEEPLKSISPCIMARLEDKEGFSVTKYIVYKKRKRLVLQRTSNKFFKGLRNVNPVKNFIKSD